MADTMSTTLMGEVICKPQQRTRGRLLAKHQLALVLIMLVSVFMNFFQLGEGGFGTYYPAAVRSMMDNWSNFFYASYDPGGFVTIDKPPVGFWLQVASAKILGFSPFSVLVPQAIAGVLAVLMLYYLIQRHFGVVAGLLAALALALSPISIVTNRNVTIDSTLALVLLVGAWAVLRAAATGQLRWLLLAAAIVGLGFNIKMMEAYLVIPAFALLYLLVAPKSIWIRIVHLLLAGMLLLVTSFSWALAVDLTDASLRPYVGSTQNNSEISLATGYNGIERLLGRFGRGSGAAQHVGGRTNVHPTNGTSSATPTAAGTPSADGTTATRGTSSANGSATTGNNTTLRAPVGQWHGLFGQGNVGPLRLFTLPLAGQIAWLLPLALLGLLAFAWQRRPNLQRDRQQQAVILWGTWVLTMGAFFSVASFFHEYYMTVMTPGIAALVGIGLVAMWQDYRCDGWKGWLLPLALSATAAEHISILLGYPTWGQWMIPLIAVLCILVVGVLIVMRLVPRFKLGLSKPGLLVPVIGLGLLATLLAPTVWAAIPVLSVTHGDVLTAGPQGGNGFASGGNRNMNTALLNYLLANQGQTKYLVATPSSAMADGIIVATNRPVMALGGFGGNDPILTTSQLATLVANGDVRFFLLNVSNGKVQQKVQQPSQQSQNRLAGAFVRGSQGALTTWVAQHCTTVPTSLWQSAAISNRFERGGAAQLYDCAAAH